MQFFWTESELSGKFLEKKKSRPAKSSGRVPWPPRIFLVILMDKELIMKDLTITLQIDGYLRQWLTHLLGNPVRFPAHSYENALLRRYVAKRPSGIPTQPPSRSDVVLVYIPDNSSKRPEYYNFLPRRAQAALLSAINDLFRLHLWSECAPLIHSTRELNRGIDEWCAANGISLDYREAVRQKFYRMRKGYDSHGIILGKKYKKSLPQSW